ncbi:hypothetical protein V7654_15365 [Bacillus sp. JJ1609]|uniref:hypothetical protein n=1 Tax=Bacillus sp. JJ1609 TaxID=3122977 RepID=UPI002FFF213A
MNVNEKYFRPSKSPALNIRRFVQTSSPLQLQELIKSPYETVIHFFSVIREAENLLPGKIGGCGTVGMAKEPFPIAYQFLSKDFQTKLSYSDFLKLFEGIGHINLLKLIPIADNQLFYEIETIEGSDKQITYFGYYYGFIKTVKDLDGFKIEEITRTGEDFLCAAYHGWAHDAEANVNIRYGEWCHMIKQSYPMVEKDFMKYFRFLGNDGEYYMIVFVELTNGTDVEIGQFVWKAGKWAKILLNPEDCISRYQIINRFSETMAMKYLIQEL